MIRVGDKVRVIRLSVKHRGPYAAWQEDFESTLGKVGEVVYINTPRTSIIIKFPDGKELCYDPVELELAI